MKLDQTPSRRLRARASHIAKTNQKKSRDGNEKSIACVPNRARVIDAHSFIGACDAAQRRMPVLALAQLHQHCNRAARTGPRSVRRSEQQKYACILNMRGVSHQRLRVTLCQSLVGAVQLERHARTAESGPLKARHRHARSERTWNKMVGAAADNRGRNGSRLKTRNRRLCLLRQLAWTEENSKRRNN